MGVGKNEKRTPIAPLHHSFFCFFFVIEKSITARVTLLDVPMSRSNIQTFKNLQLQLQPSAFILILSEGTTCRRERDLLLRCIIELHLRRLTQLPPQIQMSNSDGIGSECTAGWSREGGS
jgi:hypothetical protein